MEIKERTVTQKFYDFTLTEDEMKILKDLLDHTDYSQYYDEDDEENKAELNIYRHYYEGEYEGVGELVERLQKLLEGFDE